MKELRVSAARQNDYSVKPLDAPILPYLAIANVLKVDKVIIERYSYVTKVIKFVS